MNTDLVFDNTKKFFNITTIPLSCPPNMGPYLLEIHMEMITEEIL